MPPHKEDGLEIFPISNIVTCLIRLRFEWFVVYSTAPPLFKRTRIHQLIKRHFFVYNKLTHIISVMMCVTYLLFNKQQVVNFTRQKKQTTKTVLSIQFYGFRDSFNVQQQHSLP